MRQTEQKALPNNNNCYHLVAYSAPPSTQTAQLAHTPTRSSGPSKAIPVRVN